MERGGYKISKTTRVTRYGGLNFKSKIVIQPYPSLQVQIRLPVLTIFFFLKSTNHTFNTFKPFNT